LIGAPKCKTQHPGDAEDAGSDKDRKVGYHSEPELDSPASSRTSNLMPASSNLEM
jgi:hypothetical protein